MKLVCLTRVAAVALALPAIALAQGSVTVYGLLDVGVEAVNHVGPNSSSVWRMPMNTNTAPSRLGVRGSEDLGGGLLAQFALEMGIDPGTGLTLQGGRGWGRQSWVGLTGPWGTVSLGRQYTMTFWSGLSADILGGGIYGTGSLDSYLPNARADNAVVWRKSFDGLDLGATYSFGRDAVNGGPSPAGTNCPGELPDDSGACREWSVMAKYDTKTWGVALANDRLYGRDVGAPPDAVFGGLNSSDKTDNRLILNGWAQFGDTKFGGGVIRRSNDGLPARRNTALWYFGVSHLATPLLNIAAQVVNLHYLGVSDFNSTLVALRGTYSLSRRSALFAQIGYIDNDAKAAVAVSGGTPGSTPMPGSNQTGVNAGIRHSF